MKSVYSVALVFALIAPFAASADEPMNVLVGDLTFTRPAEWKWEAPSTNSPAVTQFVVPTERKGERTDVRFYISPRNFESASKLWKSYFPQTSDRTDVKEEKKKFRKREALFVRLRGTYVFPGARPQPGFVFYGVAIPYGKQFIHVRILGPEKIVQTAEVTFRKMVEDALKEKEEG